MKYLLAILTLGILFTSCSSTITSEINAIESYDEFWNHVDRNYVYFEEKGVDWDEVKSLYASELDEHSTEQDLKEAMGSSLLALKDNHNTLKTHTGYTEFYNFREGYDIHFSLDLVERKYLDSPLTKEDFFSYALIDDTTLYLHISKMSHIYNLKNLLRRLVTEDITTLILDVRGNSGGDSNQVPDLLKDFITQNSYLGSYVEKSGPAHEDKVIIPLSIDPSSNFHMDVDTYVLTNRDCYSATSYLAAMCKGLDRFTLVGQITGGGGGGASSFELSNGWVLTVSVSDYLDKEGQTIESGVVPDIEVINTQSEIENDIDRVMEEVLKMIE